MLYDTIQLLMWLLFLYHVSQSKPDQQVRYRTVPKNKHERRGFHNSKLFFIRSNLNVTDLLEFFYCPERTLYFCKSFVNCATDFNGLRFLVIMDLPIN